MLKKRLAAALMAFAAAVAPSAALRAQDSDSVAPYDLGFAFQAGQNCPGAVLLHAVDTETQATEQFKRGVAMFEHYRELQKLDGACAAALKLYNSETGKAAKLLGLGPQKSPPGDAGGKR